MTDSPSDKDPPSSGSVFTAPSPSSPSGVSSTGGASSSGNPPSTPPREKKDFSLRRLFGGASSSGNTPSTAALFSAPAPSSSGDASSFGSSPSTGDPFTPPPPPPPTPPTPPTPKPLLERLFGRRFTEWFRDIRRFWKVIGTLATVVAALVGLTNLALKLADPSPASAYAFYEWWHDLGRDKIVEIDSKIKKPRFLFSLEGLKNDRFSTRGEVEQSTYDLEVLHSWGGHEKNCDASERVSDKKWRKVLIGLEKAADVGYVNAQNTLGILYWCGLVVEQKRNFSIKWWQAADNQGSEHAQHNLAVAYWQEKDRHKGQSPWEKSLFSKTYWNKSAEQELAEAQYNLANIYWDGEGDKKNEEEAFLLYEKASKQGHLKASFHLGRAHMLGLGVESKNEEKAVNLWREVAVAQPSFVLPHYNLAVAHANGEGVDNKDWEQAKMWLEKVVGSKEETDDSGDYAHAHFMLGNFHLLASKNKLSRLVNSIGLLKFLEYFNYNQKHYDEAAWRYKKADNKGYAPAQYYLAFLYWDRKIETKNGDDPNRQATDLLKEAASYCLAQHALGLAYWWGEGVEKNRDTAHELLQKVSAQGLAESYYYLARYHYDKSEEPERRDSKKSDDDKNDDDKSDDNISDDDKSVAQSDIEKAYMNYIISYNLGYEKKHTQKQSVRIEKILDIEGKGDSEIEDIKKEGEKLADDIKKMEMKHCT